jgi:predicted ester cyclase
MKRTLFLAASCLLASTVFGQAKKPTIMVVPSDNWCFQNNYMNMFDNQGTSVRVPDYVLALQDNFDLNSVISQINNLMSDRGFPLKVLEQEIKSISQSNAELSMVQSKTSGAEVAESPVDALRRRAKADIIMQLTWKVNQTGPKRSVTYNLQGLDAYTNKQIAGAQGTGAPSFSAEVAVLLEEAVMAHMDSFCDRLQQHFDDLLTNGREVSLSVNVFSSSPVDLESEFDGHELSEIIDNWMADNTVNGRYGLTDSSESYMKFEQVRIPLYDERNRAMDTYAFARNLRAFLLKEPYKIESKVMNNGLGKCTIILGEK